VRILVSFALPTTPRPVQHTPGVELVPYSTRPERSSVLRARADCGGRLFPTKLGVVTHYLPHQLLDDRPKHTLQLSEARSRGSVASTVRRCNGLRTRSLKPRRVAISNRPTVTPLSRARLLHQVQTRRIRHHPPANFDSCSMGYAISASR
jgi:hypothetical protein